jgi:hypothetical protein
MGALNWSAINQFTTKPRRSLKGGYKHPKGRKAFKYNQAETRLKGKLSSHTYLQPQGQVTEDSLGTATKVDDWESDTEGELDIGDSDESESD